MPSWTTQTKKLNPAQTNHVTTQPTWHTSDAHHVGVASVEAVK